MDRGNRRRSRDSVIERARRKRSLTIVVLNDTTVAGQQVIDDAVVRAIWVGPWSSHVNQLNPPAAPLMNRIQAAVRIIGKRRAQPIRINDCLSLVTIAVGGARRA